MQASLWEMQFKLDGIQGITSEACLSTRELRPGAEYASLEKGIKHRPITTASRCVENATIHIRLHLALHPLRSNTPCLTRVGVAPVEITVPHECRFPLPILIHQSKLRWLVIYTFSASARSIQVRTSIQRCMHKNVPTAARCALH